MGKKSPAGGLLDELLMLLRREYNVDRESPEADLLVTEQRGELGEHSVVLELSRRARSKLGLAGRC